MNEFFHVLGAIALFAFFFALAGYSVVAVAVGLTWPFWMFT